MTIDPLSIVRKWVHTCFAFQTLAATAQQNLVGIQDAAYQIPLQTLTNVWWQNSETNFTAGIETIYTEIYM